jgi:hypothetical protein
VLNLTYTWLFDLIGGTDDWKKNYEHVFDPEAHSDFDYVDLGPTTSAAPTSSFTNPRAAGKDAAGNTMVDVGNAPVAKLLFKGY